ncbi:radical SAM protein [Candidatus Pacearchaeota archaeon]|nr:radical SAM protein [Candidatus Pacearchaeota archaeon]
MDQIQIVSLLLTRKCNLKCSYCAIRKNYVNMPDEYPTMDYYHKNEMSTEYVLETLRRLKLHNPNVFIIIYGGEPLLRPDLWKIIDYCNQYDINYTIITNNTPEVQPAIEKLFENTNKIVGLTSSVDPCIISGIGDPDRLKKSREGFERLKSFRGKVQDLVAEITITQDDVPYVYDLVKLLHDNQINSDVTFIDIARNEYYDFSTVRDEKQLVQPTFDLARQLLRIQEEKLDVHMSEVLLPMIYDDLPAKMDCGLEQDVHNTTIDVDGTMRMCLRIRGVKTPGLKAHDCFDPNSGELNLDLKYRIGVDKARYCQLCNWSCIRMSKYYAENPEESVDSLIHSDKRC